MDFGSQSVKAVVTNTRGEIHAESQIAVEPKSEYSPSFLWQVFCQTLHALWEQDVDPYSICGMAVTCQRAMVINLDASGEPVGPAFGWQDERKAKRVPRLNPLFKLGTRVLGISSMIERFQRKAAINRLADEQPDLHAKIAHSLLLSGYLTYRLTSQLKDSRAAQVGYLPFNFKTLDWHKPWHWQWQALAIKREQLPELVDLGAELGKVTHDAAVQTGLPERLPLIATGTDKACEVLGSGCLDEQTAHLSFGTAATCNLNTKVFKGPRAWLPAYPSAQPEQYLCEFQLNQGFWLVNWFIKEFAHRESWLTQSEPRSLSIEQRLDELLESSKPGANGVIFEPYWSEGLKFPGPEAKGAFVGLMPSHTRADYYRAMIEGILFALYQAMEIMCQRHKVPIDALCIAGGGSQSNVIRQMTADIFGLPVYVPKARQVASIGAAMSVAVALEMQPDYGAAKKSMIEYHDVVMPDPDRHQHYRKIFTSHFKPLNSALSSYYRRRE